MKKPLYPILLSEHIGLTGTHISMHPVAMANSHDWLQAVGVVDETARDKAMLAKWMAEIGEMA